MLRALVNHAAGGDTQGASTITQRYVKNFLINVVHRGDPAAQQRDRENSVARKLREAKLAVQVDRSMTKDEILVGYLNVVQFSGTVYGVAAAAEAYFGTTTSPRRSSPTSPQAILSHQTPLLATLDSLDSLDSWRDVVVEAARRQHGAGGCPLGSLSSELSDGHPGPVTPSRPASANGPVRSATAWPR